jgi:hypothetical protein
MQDYYEHAKRMDRFLADNNDPEKVCGECPYHNMGISLTIACQICTDFIKKPEDNWRYIESIPACPCIQLGTEKAIERTLDAISEYFTPTL